jgi:ribose 5-phosphate isomerase A
MQVIGLGSGPMAAEIVRQMKNCIKNKKTIEGVVTSFKIKLEAQYSELKVVDEGQIPEIDVVFDGADEIDSKYNMIKGGGGIAQGKNCSYGSQKSSHCSRVKKVCR